MITRRADARWEGDLKQGKGNIKLGSGAFEGPYSFGTRFEGAPGTNPEELLGAAHAGCFTMALSLALSQSGTPPETLHTDAKVQLRQKDGLPTITQIDVSTRAKVPGLDDATFQETANAMREQCIVSRALKGVETINLDATLES